MQRKTYAVIDGDILQDNIKEIKKKYPDYKYYFGVVKNNAYHHGIKCVIDMAAAGINYFAVSSLEEALEVRKYLIDKPILCLEPIDLDYIDDAINSNITITIESLEYLEKLRKKDLYSKLKIHLKIDSGMRRLGFTNKEDLKEAVEKINTTKKLYLEGIYSHFATSGITDSVWDKQVEEFLSITSTINIKEIPIVHFGRSLTLVNHPKLDFCNGIRLGIILYGFSQSKTFAPTLKNKIRNIRMQWLQKKNKCSKTYLTNDLNLKPIFSLYTTVMSKRSVKKGEVIGYNSYQVKEDGYILTLPIGYADGVTKEFGQVYIKNEYYPIVSDCMDMILVFSNKNIEWNEKVEIIGSHQTIKKVSLNTHKNAYHIYNDISNRVVRVHKNKKGVEEIYY